MLVVGGNLVMDWPLIQRGVVILLILLHYKETQMSLGCMSCLAYVQTCHSLCYSTFEMKTHLVKYVLYISLLITIFFSRCTGMSQF